MTKDTFNSGSLVLYKHRPARVRRVGDKIEIELAAGGTQRVRPKDIDLLHPGPLDDLDDLQPPSGEIKTAWELLAGNNVSLAELAELAYGAYTPATAWAAWERVADGLYFEGTPQEVLARPPEEVAQEQAAREAKQAEKQAWEAFIRRVRAGQIAPQDETYLRDVEALALGYQDKSQVLRELGHAEQPENAHALLLELGYWDYTVNPYPQRLRLPTSPPDLTLPELPDETRVDLTHLPAFAIDDEGNQDPDDALSLDGDRLWVHVADVAALVPPGSLADDKARARGANLYLPEKIVPMLPPQATRTLGLGLNEISPALSFGLDLDVQGESADAGVGIEIEIVPSWVRVTRLTYAKAESRLAEEPFRSLYRLAQAYQAQRRADGAIMLDLPEVKIKVVDGQVILRPVPSLRSRTLVTEAMLMAGEAAARFALERNIPFPFSTQPEPDTDERPSDLAGMFRLRRALKPSQMTSMPTPHAGLGMTAYSRATSPLRRYLDLVVHQQIRAYLRGQELLDAQDVMARIGAAEAATGDVRRAEWLSRRHWTLVYLLQHPDWQGEGIVVEKRGSRAVVLIPELDLEPRMHLRGDFALNSSVPLALQGVNLPELEAHFQVR